MNPQIPLKEQVRKLLLVLNEVYALELNNPPLTKCMKCGVKTLIERESNVRCSCESEKKCPAVALPNFVNNEKPPHPSGECCFQSLCEDCAKESYDDYFVSCSGKPKYQGCGLSFCKACSLSFVNGLCPICIRLTTTNPAKPGTKKLAKKV